MKSKCNRLLHYVLLIFMILVSVSFVPTSIGHAQTSDWTEPINLSNSGASKDPTMVVDINGVIHVIWVDEFEGYKYVSSADGVDWTSPLTVKFPFLPTDEHPKFQVTTNGVIHVFWLNDRNILNYVQTPQNNFGNPSLWRSSARLGESVVDYHVVVDNKDGVHVSYVSSESSADGLAGVYFRRSTNSGQSWSTSQMLFNSPYFRSLTSENAHVRIAVSQNPDTEDVYVVWDNPALRNIFISRSLDRGKSWEIAYDPFESEENVEIGNPYDVEISVAGSGVLLTWSVGDSRTRCSSYSRWSDNGGETWGMVLQMLDDFSVCPDQVGHANVGDDYSILLLNVQDNLALTAWNGNEWSNLQIQSGLTSLLNPLTSEPIDLACLNSYVKDGLLFVVGCDQGASQDIWFMSRVLGTLSDWFPPPSSWDSPQTIDGLQYKISSFSSVAGTDQKVHVVWTKELLFGEDAEHAIYYAEWKGGKWTSPSQIITNLNGDPDQVSVTADNQGRLILVWVDKQNGDIRFSWANSSRANIPLEWAAPKILPSPSNLVSFPDILTDAASRIVVSYAVPFNENRGVYVVRSDDFGETWSLPYTVVDALANEWDSVDKSRIALDGNGHLYALYSQYAIQDGVQSVGLYYSQSVDGGVTWDEGFMLSDKEVNWSDIIALGDLSVHFLWQDQTRGETNLHHRFTTDNGATLSNPKIVVPTNARDVLTTSAVDGNGQLHLLRFSSDVTPSLQEWKWNGSSWTKEEGINLHFAAENIILREFSASVTSDNQLLAISVVESNKENNNNNSLENQVIIVGRFIDKSLQGAVPEAGLLPLQVLPIMATTDLPIGTIPTPHISSMNFEEPQPIINKNIAGLVLMGVVVMIMIILIQPRKNQR